MNGVDIKLGLGTWGLGGAGATSGAKYGWKKLDPSSAIQTIREAYDLGIRFYDTADFYGLGLSEELLAKALPADSDIILATKGGLFIDQSRKGIVSRAFGSSYIEAAVHASLKRLNRERVDLYQLHGPPESVLLDEELWSTLRKLVKDGKIGEFGVSVSGSLASSTLQDWASIEGLGWLQVPYSLNLPSVVAHVEDFKSSSGSRVKLIGRSLFHHGILLGESSEGIEYEDSDFRSTLATAPYLEKVDSFWKMTRLRENRIELCLGIALTSRKLDIALVGASSPSQVRELVASAEVSSALSFSDRSKLLSDASMIFRAPGR